MTVSAAAINIDRLERVRGYSSEMNSLVGRIKMFMAANTWFIPTHLIYNWNFIAVALLYVISISTLIGLLTSIYPINLFHEWFKAARYSSCPERLTAVIEQDKSLDLNEVDPEGNTLLTWLIEHFEEETVSQFINNERVDLNTRDSFGETPLTLAIKLGKVAIVRRLLQSTRCMLHEPEMYSKTPMCLAIENNRVEIVELLLACERYDFTHNDYWMFRYAILQEETNIASLFIRCTRFNLNVPYQGMTPLLLAAKEGKSAIVSMLLQSNRVELNARTTEGDTALIWAASRNHPAIVKELIAMREVDRFAMNINGVSAFGASYDNAILNDLGAYKLHFVADKIGIPRGIVNDLIHIVPIKDWPKISLILENINKLQQAFQVSSSWALITFLMNQEPDLRRDVFDHLLQQMQSPDRFRAKFILDYILAHKLYNEDEKWHDAFFRTLLQDDFRPEEISPDLLTQILVYMRRQPTEAVSFGAYAVNDEGWQMLAKASTITASDLPVITAQSFQDEIKRLFRLSPEERKELIGRLPENRTIESIAQHFEDPFFTTMLRIETNDPKLHSKAMYIKVIQKMLSLTGLARMEYLMKIALNIYNCIVGKEEGLALMYHALDENDKLPSLAVVEGKRGRAAEIATLVATQAQKAVNELCASRELLDLLHLPYDGAWGVHSSLLVKNALGAHIGIPGPVQDDPYRLPFQIPSFENLYRNMFILLIPQLIDKIVQGVNQSPHCAYLLCGVADILQGKVSKFALCVETLDEAPFGRLTSKGAEELLIALGYLSRS